jgi:hypothetical protein
MSFECLRRELAIDVYSSRLLTMFTRQLDGTMLVLKSYRIYRPGKCHGLLLKHSSNNYPQLNETIRLQTSL